MILAAILDFVEEAEKWPKIYMANFLGLICFYLEIIRVGVYGYHQILMMAKMSKTEISVKILKRKKKVFIIRITPKAFQHMSRVRSFL